MNYVIGVDLGTSAVKVLLVDQQGNVCRSVSKEYPLIQKKSGYSEQDPEQWVAGAIAALQELVKSAGVSQNIEGISFSGQMHGLVLLDSHHRVIRNAILWNDTRTTEQCREIKRSFGDRLLAITKNPALEGFTLPKILWVKRHEPEHFQQTSVFLLPKDYLRYRITGQIHSDFSDAAGTLLLDIEKKQWSREVCEAFDIDVSICPPMVESEDCVGTILPEIAAQTGLLPTTKVFTGGADNACGAVGAGVLSEGKAMCSIGTSGVILSYEQNKRKDYHGKLHFCNHAQKDGYYAMGVTLAAGDSLSWFRDTFADQEDFNALFCGIEQVPAGANGLLFTPYLLGERTPHADADIRGSFIGIDRSHRKMDFARAVVEGITFSLNASIQMMRESGQSQERVISIGGGAKSETWLQIQANIFNTNIVQLKNGQGPGMGAAMLAAQGCHWFSSLDECADVFIQVAQVIEPQPEEAARYEKLFEIYQDVYRNTQNLSRQLKSCRG